MDELGQLHRLAVTDVVDPVGGAALGRAATLHRPVRISRRDHRHQSHHRLGDIVDIGEVAAHVPLVVDVDGVACQDRLGELEQRHVRTTPGAVDGEEAQAGRRQIVEMGVAVAHQLVGLLGGRIQGDRMVDAIAGGEWRLAIEAIDRAR